MPKFFPSPDPTPVDAFGASIQVSSALDPQTPLFTFLNTPLGAAVGHYAIEINLATKKYVADALFLSGS